MTNWVYILSAPSSPDIYIGVSRTDSETRSIKNLLGRRRAALEGVLPPRPFHHLLADPAFAIERFAVGDRVLEAARELAVRYQKPGGKVISGFSKNDRLLQPWYSSE